VPIAVNCCVEPTAILPIAGVTARDINCGDDESDPPHPARINIKVRNITAERGLELARVSAASPSTGIFTMGTRQYRSSGLEGFCPIDII
jgi:hypothetical protein